MKPINGCEMNNFNYPVKKTLLSSVENPDTNLYFYIIVFQTIHSLLFH